MAGSSMWRTGIMGMQLAAAAYLLPFLWAFNPAVLLYGSWFACTVAIVTASVAALLFGRMVILYGHGGVVGAAASATTFALALLVGSSSL